MRWTSDSIYRELRVKILENKFLFPSIKIIAKQSNFSIFWSTHSLNSDFYNKLHKFPWKKKKGPIRLRGTKVYRGKLHWKSHQVCLMFLKGFNLNFKYISIQSTRDDGNNHSELGGQRTEEELTKVLSVAFSFMQCFLVFKEEQLWIFSSKVIFWMSGFGFRDSFLSLCSLKWYFLP